MRVLSPIHSPRSVLPERTACLPLPEQARKSRADLFFLAALFAQVTETDMYYLQDEDLARQLVELGYRGSGDTLQR